MTHDAILEILLDAVTAGSEAVLATRQEGPLHAEYKDAKELVTAADQRSDAAMRAIFEARLEPGIAIALEESGRPEAFGEAWVGADPLDGTNHFACGGTSYAIQAHYVENGIPKVGVILQPEVYLPLAESDICMGRLAYAIRGGGAFLERTAATGGRLSRSNRKELRVRTSLPTRSYAASIPISSKMTDPERARAQAVLNSGLVAVTTGAGCAGGNALLTILGGQHIYANFGAGDDLDLIPPQVIAEEAGATVWDSHRSSPKWFAQKQSVLIAVNNEVAGRFLQAAGL